MSQPGQVNNPSSGGASFSSVSANHTPARPPRQPMPPVRAIALLAGFGLIVLGCVVGVELLGFRMLAFADVMTGARYRTEMPWLMWACWGLVIGAAMGLWLDAPLYGRRHRRWMAVTFPVLLTVVAAVLIDAKHVPAAWPPDPAAPPPPPEPEPNFAGSWDTGRWGSMTLKQDGVYVTGEYPMYNGLISGTVAPAANGDRFSYRWRNQDNNGSGVGYFDLANDSRSFTGRFTSGNELREGGGQEWNGTRTAWPIVLSTFTGVWDTEWGEVRLVQGVSTVTGTYEYGGGTIEGTLDGKTLRFRWANRVTGETGTGRFTLALYGESFEGFWGTEDNPDAAAEPWNGKRKKETEAG